MSKHHLLSKSTFMYGDQCLKRLYLHKKHPELKSELTELQKAVFSTGTDVGELSQQLFPGGVDCTPENYYDFSASIRQTKELVNKKHPSIYEAAFQHERVMAALDILVLKDDGWHGFEVKSTGSTKEQHILDSSLQYWVIVNSGLKLKTINLLHFNKKYIRKGELDIHKLFSWDDITKEVIDLQPYVEEQLKKEKAILRKRTIPRIEIGPHCSKPYDCDFIGHCWKDIPEYSVFNLVRGGKKSWDLYKKGILKTTDIPDKYRLTAAQKMQVEADKNQETIIDKPAINKFLIDLNYPLYHLDFETIMPAVPLFDQSRPIQQILFQYSLHTQRTKRSKVRHKEFLVDHKDPTPRLTLFKRLVKDLGDKGDILVFNMGFESGRLKELARDFPKHKKEVEKILKRMKDLMIPFQKKQYYSPSMQGSYSIKKVLPALVPELSYKTLEIQEGGTASLTFLQMVLGQFDGDIAKTREALIKYCEMDTYAMVKILEKLYKIKR